MEQTRLPFKEDEVLHLVDVAVESAGGTKEVGSRFKPEMGPIDAGKWIKRCVNPGHKDQLYARHYIRTLLGARYRNNHDAMNALLKFCGYVPNATPQSSDDIKHSFHVDIQAFHRMVNETFEKMDQLTKREKGEF